jgi:hypothetical protein
MKKYFYVICILLFAGKPAHAAAGDTTWVQANIDTLAWYGNYDATASFPASGSYRNIYMIFTLGKYVCPGSPTYCGDWDYTVQNYLMTPDGDTLELGRLITPYANAGAPRTPWAWKQRYVFEVTDYAAMLKNMATVRIHYSGYSGGFTANVRFAFVHGTPDRNVTGYQRLWHGSFGYGGSTDMSTKFTAVPAVAPDGTKSATLKFNITGHGSDNLGCCEFLEKNYHVFLNGSSVASKSIWRDDCGENQLYPQSGTWVYNRANWCPGNIVNSNFHPLTGITSGSNFNVGMVFDAYTSPGGGLGSYTTETHLIYHGDFNKLKDASIEDIIAPTNHENHFRENPICTNPLINIMNRGANPISLIELEYGVQGTALQTYTWTGMLNPLESADVALPELANLKTLAGDTTKYTFVARIKNVNGSKDADTTNNIMKSTFATTPKWDGKFRIQFRTNSSAIDGYSESSWKIYDQNNVVVKQRTNLNVSTLYTDTVTLPTGCYKLEVNDLGCDGLNWWASVTGGSMLVKKIGDNSNLPLNGYTNSGTYAHDFGCKFTQYFYTNTPTGVSDIASSNLSIETFPNPAKDVIFIDISGQNQVNGTIHIIDAIGRIVKTIPCETSHIEMNTNGMSTGIYTVLFVNEDGNKLQSRVMVSK